MQHENNNNAAPTLNDFEFEDAPAPHEPLSAAVPPAFHPPRGNPTWTTPAGGFMPLGHIGANMLIWSQPLQAVEEMTPSRLARRHDLQAVCGPVWTQVLYTRTDEKGNARVAFDDLASDIIETCHAKGHYDTSRVRGPGVWLEDGALVVNSREVWRPDGQPVSRTGGKYIYAASADIGMDADGAVATAADLAEVRDTLRTWSYQRESDAALMLGWLASAVLPGTMLRRPHVVLTGQYASGKSTLKQFIADILGPAALSADGSSTPAGIRQLAAQSAMALLIDEAEDTDEGTQRTKQLVSMLRSAYGDEGGTLRGTTDQTGRRYSLQNCGLLAAIVPPAMKGEDLSRFLRIDIGPLTDNAKKRKSRILDPRYRHEARALGDRFRALVLRRYDVFVDSLPVVQQDMIERGFSPRAADTVGTVLGWVWSLSHSAAPTDAEARALVDSVDLSIVREAQDVTTEATALDRLLDALHEGVAVQDHLVAALRTDSLRHPTLETLGMRVTADHAGHYMLAVASAPDHPGLRALYRGSAWEAGGWAIVLTRTAGASRKKLQIANRVRDAVLVPIPADVLAAAGKHVTAVQQPLPGLGEAEAAA